MKTLNRTKKMTLAAVFLMLSMSFATFAVPARSQAPLPTILILSDGSVSPASAPINRAGCTYTFTDNIYSAIKILKSNIVLDGAGYTLSGPYNGRAMDAWVIGEGPDQLANGTLAQYTLGIDLWGADVNGVTVENLNIKNFNIGMYMWTKNNTVTGNSVSDNIVGILLSGSNETVTKNLISDNQRGLFFGFNNPNATIPPDIEIDHNDFENNVVQLNGCQCKDYNTSEPPHSWDDGRQGNFWSDYNGTDANHDGVGDTPYTIDPLNRDRYPLMVSPVKPPVSAAKFPVEAVVFGFSAAVVVAVVAVAYRRRKKK
jgi:parallel beta-helix repeat protein